MKAFQKELELISLVNSNYSHVEQLETLSKHYKDMKESDYSKEYPNEYNLTQDQIDKLFIICRTTHNSHYEMRLFTCKEFQDESNVVSNILKDSSIRSFKKEYYNTFD